MLFVFILEAELATDDRPIRGDGTLVNSTPRQDRILSQIQVT